MFPNRSLFNRNFDFSSSGGLHLSHAQVPHASQSGERFQVVKKLGGNGGYCNGGVFICLDNVTNKYVIKKKLTDKDIRSGLGKRELNALKQLNHENINRFVDGYVDKERMTGSIYLEYCDQGTLYDLIKAHARSHSSLPEGFLIRVLDGVVAGIRYMHKGPSGQSNRQWNTLVHRDLKPANIFLKASQNPYPRAVIGDFGCCASDSDLRSGRATETVERQDPRFAPPEAPRYYRSSDIFQIGMIIVCMARLENEVSRSTRVEHGRPLGWGYSAEINHVVQKCILPDPEQRIRTSELVPVLDRARGDGKTYGREGELLLPNSSRVGSERGAGGRSAPQQRDWAFGPNGNRGNQGDHREDWNRQFDLDMPRRGRNHRHEVDSDFGMPDPGRGSGSGGSHLIRWFRDDLSLHLSDLLDDLKRFRL